MKNLYLRSSNTLLILLASAFPVIECIQGYIFNGDTSKSLTNIYSAITITLLLLFIKPANSKNGTILTYIFGLALILITATKGLFSGNISYDFFAILRSLLLGTATYLFSSRLNDSQKIETLTLIAKLTWYLITLTILFSELSGTGLYTYDEFKVGHKFYFPSVNELNFVYISSIAVLLTIEASFKLKIIKLLISLICFSIIGNKSFIPLLFLIYASNVYLNAKITKKMLYLCAPITILIILFAAGIQTSVITSATESIVFLLSKFSSGAEKFATKLSYLNVFSALLSERDTLAELALDLVHRHYDSLDIMIGINLSEYGALYGPLRGKEFSFSENDILDLFMSYGCLGLIFFFTLAKKIYSTSALPEIHSAKTLKRTLVILFVICGALTGHVYLFGYTCFIFSLYCGLLSTSSSRKGLIASNEKTHSI